MTRPDPAALRAFNKAVQASIDEYHAHPIRACEVDECYSLPNPGHAMRFGHESWSSR